MGIVGRILLIDGCWVYEGCRNSHGYGQINTKINGIYKRVYLHRIMFEIFIGKLVKGKELDHLCKNTYCVNPYHLEQVSHRVNCLRGISPASLHAKKTRCPKEHQYSHVNSRGQRVCRLCLMENSRRDYARKKMGLFSL